MKILESSIESVTVYHRGATVRRVAKARECGSFKVPGLPLSLVDSSIKVHIETKTSISSPIWANNISVGLYTVEKKIPAKEKLKAKLKEYERKLMHSDQKARQIELERDLLSTMDIPKRPQAQDNTPPPSSPVRARVMLEEFLNQSIKNENTSLKKLKREIQNIEKEIKAIEAELSQYADEEKIGADDLSKVVIFELKSEAKAPKEISVYIDYHIPGVRWVPAYKCYLNRNCTEAEIHQRALIAQQSGEDWKGVKLKLSTADALNWTELPELTSFRIGKKQHHSPTKKGFRPPPRGAKHLYADHDRDYIEERFIDNDTWQAPLLHPASPIQIAEVAENIFVDFSGEPMRTGVAYPEAAGGYPADDFEAMMAGASAEPEDPSPASRPMPRMAKPTGRMKRRPTANLTNEMPLFAETSLGSIRTEMALMFSELRLGDPNDKSKRSRLLPIDRFELYRETLPKDQEILIDIVDVVKNAQRKAAEVALLKLPETTADVKEATPNFDYSYQADAIVDIVSDGQFHSIPIGQRRAEGKTHYVIVPRYESSAYRVAQLMNPLDAPLLPGPVEVYVGGQYILSTELRKVAPKGEFTLGLGVEDAIKVSRNAHFQERRSDNKVVAMTELSHSIAIEVFNHLERDIQCEIREIIPIATDGAEVDIEEKHIFPSWEKYEQSERNHELEGGRRWITTIGAAKSKSFNAEYVLRIYANNEIVGGNRREA